jgi:hypothetical protein
MTNSIDGFYSVYITGKEGQGFAIIALMAGRVVGADAAGFLLNGQYSKKDDAVSVSLSIKAPPNMPRVQGGLTGPQGEESQLDFDMPQDFASQNFIRIETQHGPINAKLIKLRDLSD